MDIVSLGSGSKGNSTYVYINGVHILIDVGLSMKQINLRMQESVKFFSLSDIDLVLITHTHTDHISSLNSIIKNFPNVKVVMNKAIYEEYLVKTSKYIDKETLILIEQELQASKIKIKAFDLNHDVACIGYTIMDNHTKETFTFIADNGGIPYKRWDDFKGSTYYAIESNHDLTLQILDPNRNELLKRRVLGFYGHTHNEYAFNLANHIVTNNTKGIMFHHLSEDCNSLELIKETHDTLMSIWGEKTKFKDIKIIYALQKEPVILCVEE